MYRLHIDIPIGYNLDDSATQASQITLLVKEALERSGMKIEMNYRLGNDEDRGKKNYLDINENGHASNKKIRHEVN